MPRPHDPISIHLADDVVAHGLAGLLPVFESLMPLRFEPGPHAPPGCAAHVLAPGTPLPPGAIAPGAATLRVPHPARLTPGEAPRPVRLRFADDPRVPWPFRGQALQVNASLDDECLAAPLPEEEFPLAWTHDGRVVWSVGTGPRAAAWRTALRPPLAAAGQDVGLAAAGERFIHTLPLMEFLRVLSRPRGFVEPPLRASFIIDDPNLHWPRYGHVDYRAIARSARQDGYHVAFATIPLDAWWVHAATASLFRAHPDALSLAVHGNNHGPRELATPSTTAACGALLQQAAQRIARLEARAGVAVSPVMIPPHGACSSRMLSQLPRHGFEGACISAGSLRAHNPAHPWTRTLGLRPGEWVQGCPVMPRWGLAAMTPLELLTAAYLGQPLVLRGHHQDLKGGLDVLRAWARAINALGRVRWADLRTLGRLNFRTRREGDTLHVQALGNHLDVPVPEGVQTLRLDAGSGPWRSEGPAGCTAVHRRGEGWILRPAGPGLCSLARLQPALAPTPRAAPRSTPMPLLVRRALTEARDRLMAW